jgi:UDP-N-acetylglucosamine 4-epimerase
MKLTTKQKQEISASTFLVTGGAGFIGSHTAECLLNSGARKVRILDNLSTGRFRNMAPFANHPRFEFLKGNIGDVETCIAACNGMDYVFHFAASEPINVAITSNDVNTTGFLNMLAVAQTAGVNRFVYAAGAESINELYADQFAKLYGMETIGLRYANVFGPRQNPQSRYAAVIPEFVTQLMKHAPLVINGAGEYTHAFNYIENVVEANMLAALTSDPEAVNQVYDITFEERNSLYQLALCLKEYLSVFDEKIAGVEIVHEPAPADQGEAVAVTEKAKELLGYQCRYTLRTGLLLSASWYWAYLPQFAEEKAENKVREFEISHSPSAVI